MAGAPSAKVASGCAADAGVAAVVVVLLVRPLEEPLPAQISPHCTCVRQIDYR